MSDKQIEALKLALEHAKRDERHMNNAETRYWCRMYRDIAEKAIEALAEQPAHKHFTKALRYDLSPAMIEGEIRDKLIELGWTPPEQPAQDQGQSCPNCEALSKQVTALKTCLEVERGFREQEQPAQQQTAESPDGGTGFINGVWHAARQWNAGVPSLYPEPEPGVSIKATYEQPAQQQEPYGWKVYGVNSLFMGEFAEADAKAEAKRIGGTCIAFPLYTSPQSKPWVGLTKEDRYKAIRPLYCDDATAALAACHSNDEYEAIEAKLREKNA